MKRALSIILTICLMMSMLPTGIFSIAASASEESVPISATKTGTCGDSAQWVYYEETRELKIFGSGAITGELAPAGYMKNAPWSSFGADIKSISVANGITSIPEGAFRSCTNLESLSVPFIGKSRSANEGYDQVLGYVFGGTNSNEPGTTLQYQKYVYNGAIYYYLYFYYYIPATLKEVIITAGNIISGSPFLNCKNIRSVGLSDSIVSIGSSVFNSCSRITDVWYEGTEDEKNNISIGNNNGSLTSATWHYNACMANSIDHTHSFDNCETTLCSNCKEYARSVAPGHAYDDCNDTSCNGCDYVRVAPGHTYDDCYDLGCNVCEFVRSSEHEYKNGCDATCEVCSYTRDPFEHVYSNECDTTCDECGETRITGPFTITYHLDGGTNALKNPDVYTSEDVITLKDATKDNYYFDGWFLDPEMTEQISVISDRTGNLNLYAKFTPKNFTATFQDGVTLTLKADGFEDKAMYLRYGETIDPYSVEIMSLYLPDNQKSNYESDPNFSGWFYDSDYTERVTDGVNITIDTILYCHFNNTPKQSSSAVFYDYYSNHEIDDLFIRVPTLSDGIVEVSFSYQLHHKYGSTTYYSSGEFEIWNRTTGRCLYRESWAGDKDTEKVYAITTLSVTPGDVIEFDYTGPTCGGCALCNYVYAFLSIRTNRESAPINSDHSITSTIPFKGVITPPSPNNKNGYSFVGWYDETGSLITETYQYTTNQTFIPKWQPINYYITYNLDGGINNLANPSSYIIEDSIILKNPSKAGYTFKGWYSDANFTTQVTSISNKTENITLYAKWEVNSYNLTLDADTGVFAPKVTFVSDGLEIKSCYLYEQDTITAYHPTGKDGYIFAGWYTDDTFTSLFKFNRTIADDITLHAKWVECNSNAVNIESVENVNTTIQGKAEQLYAFVPLVDGKIMVTSDSNNLDLYGILYDASKSVLTYADDISSTDLDFTYAYNVKAGQLYYISVKGNTASTTGQAVINIGWTGNCTITGTTYQNRQLTVAYDTDYNLPAKPFREGYVFLGWFDENNTQITDGTWNFVTDKTLTAKWEEAAYHTVVFKDLAGNIISSETYYLSEDIVAPELPVKPSDNTYTYRAKWDNDYTGVCTGDAVYSPVFDAEYIEYTVVFADEDGTELSRGTYHWGDVVTAPAAPAKAPDASYANIYTFEGWDDSVVNCAGDAIYTATYTAVPLKQLAIASQPEKVRYCTGENLDLTGLTLQLVYANGTMIPLDSVEAKFVSVDLATSGRKVATITIAGVSTEFEIYVHNVTNSIVNIDSSLYPQSSHNYSNNQSEIKTFTYPGAQSLIITFNSRTCVENGYDYIYIYDGNIKLVAKYTGTEAANKTLTITGNTFSVKLTSDSSQVKYGYAFSSIQADMGNGGEIIHRPVTDPATVTCTQDGLTEGSHCEICGDVLVAQEEAAALGHQHKTAFVWSEDHTSCTATITCERGCGLNEVVNCTVTHSETNQAQTIHTAVAEHDGARFTNVLTCDNYLIVFKDWDDTQIGRTYYHTGDTVIIPANPSREADNTYTYTFKGWDNAVVNCTGNATYTATYNATYIDYTVVFKNWNGDILSTKIYHYGDEVEVPSDPTKTADKTYTYTFAGWDKAVVSCTGDAVYIATYTPAHIEYTVVFKNWNGTVISSKTYHWGDVVAEPATPTKPADNTYTYAFTGWDKEVVNCAGNVTYTATFSSTNQSYTIVFKNWDGTVLSTKTYHYGDEVTAPVNPTRVADNTYTYIFKGWDKPVANCAGNATYTAQYTAVYKNYTITFKNWDGTVMSTKTYHYGDAVTAPSNPTRSADNTYTYAFKSWDKTVTNCTGNAIYTAQYTAIYRNYTIVFKNWDGSVLSTNTYHWGDTVTEPATPTKPADNAATYAFAGWDKEVVNCAGNTTYTATFFSTNLSYTVVFKNWDGTVLSSKTYHYGDEVTAPAKAMRAADNTYTYTFKGWDKTVVNCAGNATYTAQYTTTYKNYTITFKNWDGTVLSGKTYHYGDKVAAPANPTRTADNTYTYIFKGWDKEVVNCAGNATYTAQYTAVYKNYTITFKNWDGSVVNTKTYHYGDKVTAPAAPTRPNDANFAYTFIGWDKEVVNCTGNATYTAVYSAKSLVPSTITSSTFTINGSNISKISIGTTVTKLMENINEKQYVKVFKGNAEVSGNTLVGTGMVVKIMDGNTVKATYTLVVTGDTNGDGKITVTDFVQMQAHLLNKTLLKGAAAQAADTSGDGKISVTDYVQLQAHILGKSAVQPRSA